MLSLAAQNQIKKWENSEKVKGLNEQAKSKVMEAFLRLKEANFTGVFNLDEEIYHLMPGLNSSSLKHFLASPERYQSRVYEEKAERKKVFDEGHFVHDLLLEPEKLNQYYNDDELMNWTLEQLTEEKRGEVKSVRSLKIYKEQTMEITKAGKKLIDGELYTNASKIIASISRNMSLKSLLDNSRKELTCFSICDVTGLIRRARFDILSNNGYMADIKTIGSNDDLSTHSLRKRVVNFAMDTQSIHYQLTFEKATGQQAKGFLFGFVERRAPFQSKLVKLDFGTEEKARENYFKTIIDIANCYEKDIFLSETNNIEELAMPHWYFQAE